MGALCHLERLALLDLAQNAIGALEDIATLVVNARLIGLRLKGNPIASRSGYEMSIRALLPKVQYFDVQSLRPYSDFEQFGTLAFVSVTVHVSAHKHTDSISESSSLRSDSLKRGSVNRYTKRPSRELMSATPPHRQPQQLAFRPWKSTKSTPLARSAAVGSLADLHDFRPNTVAEGPPELPRKRSEPELPRKRSEPMLLHIREQSPIKEETSPIPVPVTQHSRANHSFEQALSFLTEAEKRLGDEAPSIETLHVRRDSKDNSVSIITAEAIQQAHERRYGNPVAALMIGPPATPQKNRYDQPRKDSKPRSVPKARSSSKSREGVVQVDLGRRFR